MFGHDDDNKKNDQSQIVTPPNDPVADATLAMDSAATQINSPPLSDSSAIDNNSLGDSAAPDSLPTEQAGAPTTEETSDSMTASAPSLPDATMTPDDSTSTIGSNDLLNIKKEALEELMPLVSHLDQTPEEKFKTTMMMIQASDNQSLIKTAYEAAGQITDEKAKAQALLDVVNEINYFNQQQNS